MRGFAQQMMGKLGLVVLSAAMALAFHPTPVWAQGPAPADPNDEWLDYKGDAQRTGSRNITLGAQLNLLWRHSADVLPREFIGSPLVTGTGPNRRVYFATGRSVLCLEGETGALAWRFDVLTSAVTAPLVLWRDRNGANPDLILVVTARGRLCALNAADGRLAWDVDAHGPVKVAAPVLAQTVNGQRVIIATTDSHLIAFDREGKVDTAWQVTLSAEGLEPTSSPAVSPAGDMLYVTVRDRNVYVVNSREAKVERTVRLRSSSFLTPLLLGDLLIVCNEDAVNTFAAADGKPLWRASFRTEILASPAGRLNKDGSGTVFIGTAGGLFYALNTKDGSTAWQSDVAASLSGTPCVVADLILVGSANGILFGLKPDDGTVVWRYRLHTERSMAAGANSDSDVAADAPVSAGAATRVTSTYGVSTTPAVVGNEVMLLGDNAAFYAFTTQPRDIDTPQVIEPSLSIPDTAGKLQSFTIDPAAPRPIPGKAPVYFAAQLVDTGSGIDPASIKATFNRQEVPATGVFFQDAKGVLTVTLAERPGADRDRQSNLDDGVYTIAVTARDYSNNVLTYSLNFTVDNSIPTPVAALVPTPVAPATPGAGAPGVGTVAPAQPGVPGLPPIGVLPPVDPGNDNAMNDNGDGDDANDANN